MKDCRHHIWSPPRLSRSGSATRIDAPGHVSIMPLKLREPGPGEVRIAIEGCGVCASNLGPWAAPDWQTFPMEAGEMGHEGWGLIEATGPDAGTFAKGQRVAFLGSHGFATHEIVPAEDVFALPASLAGQPVPAEPIACAMNIFRRSAIQRGDCVAIVGIGFLGALLTSLASRAGARVIAVSRRPSSLKLAKLMGASEHVVMDDHWRVIEEVASLSGGALCDIVIECTGKQWPLDLSAELLKNGGRLLIAGYHQDGPRQVNMQMWNWKGIDVINAHERSANIQRRGMKQAIKALAEGELDPTPLYSAIYPLKELGEALDATRDKPGDFVKALIRCT